MSSKKVSLPVCHVFGGGGVGILGGEPGKGEADHLDCLGEMSGVFCVFRGHVGDPSWPCWCPTCCSADAIALALPSRRRSPRTTICGDTPLFTAADGTPCISGRRGRSARFARRSSA